MAVAQNSTNDYLESAHQLAAKVANATDRIEQERMIPPEIANEMADKGLFRLLVPRSLGGGEIDYLDYLRIITVFAEEDASTAWTMNQINVFATHSVRIPEPTAKEIWSERRAVVTNGPPSSSAMAVPVDGGYRLTGRWNFSTGIRHGTWVAALAPVRDSADNEGVPTGQEKLRMLIIPQEDINIIDVWQVNGLRGTGTFSFETDDLYVPAARTYDPSEGPREKGALYVIPAGLLFGGGFATVALGVARDALDAAIDMASRGPQHYGREILRTKSTTQRQVGQAEAIWRSSRAFLNESISSVWESARKRRSLTVEERIQIRLSITHAVRMSAEVVDIAYNLCGSASIFQGNTVQRCFQDVHVITQQGQGRMAHYETAGQFFLGMEPEGIF